MCTWRTQQPAWYKCFCPLASSSALTVVGCVFASVAMAAKVVCRKRPSGRRVTNKSLQLRRTPHAFALFLRHMKAKCVKYQGRRLRGKTTIWRMDLLSLRFRMLPAGEQQAPQPWQKGREIGQRCCTLYALGPQRAGRPPRSRSKLRATGGLRQCVTFNLARRRLALRRCGCPCLWPPIRLCARVAIVMLTPPLCRQLSLVIGPVTGVAVSCQVEW